MSLPLLSTRSIILAGWIKRIILGTRLYSFYGPCDYGVSPRSKSFFFFLFDFYSTWEPGGTRIWTRAWQLFVKLYTAKLLLYPADISCCFHLLKSRKFYLQGPENTIYTLKIKWWNILDKENAVRDCTSHILPSHKISSWSNWSILQLSIPTTIWEMSNISLKKKSSKEIQMANNLFLKDQVVKHHFCH